MRAELEFLDTDNVRVHERDLVYDVATGSEDQGEGGTGGEERRRTVALDRLPMPVPGELFVLSDPDGTIEMGEWKVVRREFFYLDPESSNGRDVKVTFWVEPVPGHQLRRSRND